MTDERALLISIRLHPAEDTPRLALADWYQEHGQPERAEYVRGTTRPPDSPQYPYCRSTTVSEYVVGAREGCLRCLALSRLDKLREAHSRDWLRVPCVACEGTGSHRGPGVAFERCRPCRGTGDGARYHDGLEWTWDRGFPVAVSVPTLAECVEEYTDGQCRNELHRPCMKDGLWHSHRWCPTCAGTGEELPMPAPWLAALLAAHPTVARVVPRDREPYPNSGYSWYRRGRGNPSELVPEAAELSDHLFDLLPSSPMCTRWKNYDTRADAVDSLAETIANWARPE